MMKKLLLLWVVLGFCSSVMAAGHVELRIAPEDVNLGGYQTSDTITIQIYATGFYENYPSDTIGFMDIAAVLTDNGGTASAPSLHSNLATREGVSPGTIVNSGGVLIEDIRGYMPFLDVVGVYPFPAVLWECEFHIPDAPLSSIITISLSGLSLKNVGNFTIEPAYTVSGPLEIQMACCPGDISQDGMLTLTDFFMLRGRLSNAKAESGDYEILPNDPCAAVAVLWEPCGDISGDNKLTLTDFFMLRGRLSNAKAESGDYEILPDDPCEAVRALWPCP